MKKYCQKKLRQLHNNVNRSKKVSSIFFAGTFIFDLVVVSQFFSEWTYYMQKLDENSKINDAKTRAIFVSHMFD